MVELNLMLPMEKPQFIMIYKVNVFVVLVCRHCWTFMSNSGILPIGFHIGQAFLSLILVKLLPKNLGTLECHFETGSLKSIFSF